MKWHNACRMLCVVVVACRFMAGAITSAADPLTPAERAWLDAHQPIVFVSQTTYPPFEFVDEVGARRGMCLDLARWIAEIFEFEVEFANMTFQEAQHAILDGRADVLTSFFYSDERARQFDFTDMTWEVPAVIFVRAERPDIREPDDLEGKRIAMQRGDYAAEFLTARGITYELVPTASFAEAADRVIAGEADAMIGDRPIVLYHLFSRGLTAELKSVGEPLYIGRNGMAARGGRRELIGILNRGMALAREDSVFDDITTQWLGMRYDEPRARPYQYAVALGAGLMVLLVFLAWAAHLRRALARRTLELEEARDPGKPIVRPRIRRALFARLLLLLCFLLALGFAANHWLYHRVIMPPFYELEQEDARQNLRMAMEALRRESVQLGKVVSDWAYWDDTYAFVEDRDEAYTESNFTWPSLSEQSQIDMILIYALDGELVAGGVYDPFDEELVALEEVFPEGPFPAGHMLLRHRVPPSPQAGVVLTPMGPLFVASCAILPSEMDGPARGTFVMGRFLRDALPEQLSDWMGVTIQVADPVTEPFDAGQDAVFARLAPGRHEVVETSPDSMTGRGVIGDVEGQPALLLTVEMPRDVVLRGRATGRLFAFVVFQFMAVIYVGTGLWFALSFREAIRRRSHVEALVEHRAAALRASEEKWKSYVQSAPVGIFMASLEGRIQEANPAACRMLGYDEERLIGTTIEALLAPGSQDDGRAHLDRVLNEGNTAGDVSIVRGDGEERRWTVSAVRLYGDRILSFAEDITDRRKAEQERERLEAQLAHVQKLEAVGRLAGGVAHDFNNMLAVILVNTDMAITALPEEHALHESLQEIRRTALRSAGLTRQLLAFARRQAVSPEVLDLNDTVESMLQMLERLIGEQVVLRWQPDRTIGLLKMDPSQVDQILVNLCVNARDAVGESGTTIIATGARDFDALTCARHEGAVPGSYVWLSVEDDGCGMSVETLAQLYEPFFTTKPVGEGTGLGMATVYGIVRQNGGFIEVRSREGKGTKIIIYFPLHAGAFQPSEPESGADGQDARGTETILLVEDESVILNMIARLLERQGYRVLPAVTPTEAERIVREYSETIDLLISDVVMPGMNGRDLAQRLVKIRPALKRLFMSGYNTEIIAKRDGYGDVEFIQKPFSSRELEIAVRRVLNADL